MNVWKKKEDANTQAHDKLNHYLGMYIGYAFNEPKNYPSKPFTYDQEELKPMTDDEMEKQARKNTIKMGGVINDS